MRRGKLYRNLKEITKEDIMYRDYVKLCTPKHSHLKLGKVYLKRINSLKLNRWYTLQSDESTFIDECVVRYLELEHGFIIRKHINIDYIDKECMFDNDGWYFTYNNKYYMYVRTYGQGTHISIKRIEKDDRINRLIFKTEREMQDTFVKLLKKRKTCGLIFEELGNRNHFFRTDVVEYKSKKEIVGYELKLKDFNKLIEQLIYTLSVYDKSYAFIFKLFYRE